VRKRRRPAWPAIAAALAVAIVPVLGVERAGAQRAVTSEEVAAVAADLNCPMCQGYTLQECPLEACAELRDSIRESLAAGRTKAEIMAEFEARYGPQVLNAPPRRGFYALAWIVPAAVFACGALALARRATAWRRAQSVPSAPVPASVDPERERRLEEMARDR
jgi:cytochrome c-type biogenesis protein CcmH